MSPFFNLKSQIFTTSSDRNSFFRSIQLRHIIQLTDIFYHGAYQANRDLRNDKAIHQPDGILRMIELVLLQVAESDIDYRRQRELFLGLL